MTSSVLLIPLLPSGLFLPSFDPKTEGYLFTFPFTSTTSPLRNLTRQDAPHPHQVVEVDVPGKGREIFVPDLGDDAVHRLKIVGEGKNMKWERVDTVRINGDEGGGPRHVVVSKDGESRCSSA